MKLKLLLLISGTFICLNSDAQFTYQGYIAVESISECNVHIADIDSDGDEDLLTSCWPGVSWIQNNGEGSFSPPLQISGFGLFNHSLTADFDGDNDLDIVSVESISSDKIVYFENLGEGIFGSEQLLNNSVAGPRMLAVGDIDGDPELEIVFGGYDSSRKLYAVNPDGSDVNGFPIVIDERMRAGVALADFNSNGKDDIVFGTDDEHIYLVLDDGTISPGFPFLGDSDFRSEPAIFEYNNEIMILMGSKDGTLYSINSYGELIFSIETSDDIMASPSILTAQGYTPMIFFGNNDGEVHALYPDGTYVDGWPIFFPESIISSPVFSDLDSDFIPEIIFFTGGGNLHIINLDGTSYPSAPMTYTFPYSSSPAIHDLDSDGDLEVFGGTADGLNVLDIKENGNNIGYWNTFKANLHRNSYYSNQLMGDVNTDSNIDILDVIEIVGYILSTNQSIDFYYADMNYYGYVDISDIILILNHILLD